MIADLIGVKPSTLPKKNISIQSIYKNNRVITACYENY